MINKPNFSGLEFRNHKPFPISKKPKPKMYTGLELKEITHLCSRTLLVANMYLHFVTVLSLLLGLVTCLESAMYGPRVCCTSTSMQVRASVSLRHLTCFSVALVLANSCLHHASHGCGITLAERCIREKMTVTLQYTLT